MVRIRQWLAFAIAFGLTTVVAFAAGERLRYEQLSLEDRRSMQQEVRMVIGLLENHHFRSRPLVDLDPGTLIDAYLKVLDPARLYFLESDVRFIKRRFGRTLMSSYLLSGDLYPAFDIYETYAQRLRDREAWIEQRLDRPFDLTGTATFAEDRADMDWPRDAAAADALWEKLLTEIVIGERLAGGDEAVAIAGVRRRHEASLGYLAGTHPDDIHEMFLNAMLSLQDPHSGYDSASSVLAREMELTGTLVGIGVDLTLVAGEFLIEGVIPGGAADLSGLVRAGDRIVTWAEPGGDPVPVHGMRLLDLVRRLRGEPETEVVIGIETPGVSERREVPLRRAAIQSGNSRARAVLVTVPRGEVEQRVGVIQIPLFYGPSEADAVAPGVSDDVAQLLAKLQAAGVEAVVLDLRENPGGLTSEAVRLVGHFINQGPVILMSGTRGRVETASDDVPGALYAGPLVVLTSVASASAGELAAGALQSYQRAIVAGGATTFGKGTAQTVVTLADVPGGGPGVDTTRWGALRLTAQKFYLADGRSTQLKGVASDIVLPQYAYRAQQTEADLPGALPWNTIGVDDFAAALVRAQQGVAVLKPTERTQLGELSRKRQDGWPEFDWLTRVTAIYENDARASVASLNLEQRLAEKETRDANRRALRREGRKLGSDLPYGVRMIYLDAVIQQQRAHVTKAVGKGDLPWTNRYASGIYYYQDGPDGLISEVRINSLDRERLLDDVVELAEAFSAAAGVELASEVLAGVLGSSDRESDLETATAAAAGLDPVAQNLDRGLAALVRRGIALDPVIIGAPSVLDVHLRESVRVALDWAEIRSAVPVGGDR